MRHHLAQVNIARMRGDLNDPVMAGLVARVDEMNALAEGSKGFVWRLGGNITPEALRVFSTYFVPFVPSRLFYNSSVWESIADLRHFIANTAHAEMLRDRHRWIDHFDRASLALWWTPVGYQPSIAESAERLRSVEERGASAYAFTFSTLYRPEGELCL